VSLALAGSTALVLPLLAGIGAQPAAAGVPTTWTVAPSPNQGSPAVDNTLTSVSCVSATFCMAVGTWDNGTGLIQTLAEKWNGTSWSIVNTPNPTDDTASLLVSVSCVSASFCAAVGYAGAGANVATNGQPLIEQWDGTSWTLEFAGRAPPLPSAALRGQLYGVSCVSATQCAAVGSWETVAPSVPQALAIAFNGTTWSAGTVPSVGTAQVLSSVSCPTATTCLAVGNWQQVTSGPVAPLVEQWNGSTWGSLAQGPPASLGGTGSGLLNSVSCAGATACMAVGVYDPGSGVTDLPYGEFWNGTTFTAVPASSSLSQDTFTSVSCISTVGCTALGVPDGEAHLGGASYPAIVDWTGQSTWQSVPPATTPLLSNPYFLWGISCVAAVSCVAVGSQPGASLHQSTLTLVGPVLQGGYWLVASDGGVFSFGSAIFYGSTGGITLNAPIVDMATTPDRQGYWLVGSDGGIFCFGDAGFYGSTGGITLNKPIVAMAVTPDGAGYWLVGSDGGIFTFGDAGFYGSTGAITLNAPIVGMQPTPDGHGYWLVGSDGGIFNYGDALFLGSTGAITLNKPIVAMAAAPDGHGYWLVGSDGGIFSYGDSPFFGSTGGMTINAPIVATVTTYDGQGYWLAGSDGGVYAFGDAGFYGSTGGITLNKPIVAMAASS